MKISTFERICSMNITIAIQLKAKQKNCISNLVDSNKDMILLSSNEYYYIKLIFEPIQLFLRMAIFE